MTEKSIKALLATGPGFLKEGLMALIEAIPQIELLGKAGDVSSALSIIEQHNPDLVLLSTNLPREGAWVLLRHLKSGWPEIKCIVLAGDIEQQKLAEENHAALAFLEGTSAVDLVTAIERLAHQVQRDRQSAHRKGRCGLEKGEER